MVLELDRIEELTNDGVLDHSILDGVKAVQEMMIENDRSENIEDETRNGTNVKHSFLGTNQGFVPLNGTVLSEPFLGVDQRSTPLSDIEEEEAWQR
jgi:hypothetical protein